MLSTTLPLQTKFSSLVIIRSRKLDEIRLPNDFRKKRKYLLKESDGMKIAC